jgi:hypothetical protein
MSFEPSKESVRISDHAMLRCLERAMGLNIEIVREHILSICSNPAAFGAVCVRSDGMRFEIVNGAVMIARDHAVPSHLTIWARGKCSRLTTTGVAVGNTFSRWPIGHHA